MTIYIDKSLAQMFAEVDLVGPAVPVIEAPPEMPAVPLGSETSTEMPGPTASESMQRGVEIALVSMVTILIILGIYYLSLKLLGYFFPPSADESGK